MSEFHISIPGGQSKRLLTGGKYVPEDILVTAEGGGFTPPTSEVLDPDEVYRTTRPADWLTMPTPGDDEMYFLCHIEPNRKGLFHARITFTGACTVEFGTVIDGEFVANVSENPLPTRTYTKIVDGSMCSNQTADGKLQCMVKVKGAITDFDGTVSGNTAARHCAVDAVCGISLNSIQFGTTVAAGRSWFRLRYFRFVGNGGCSSFPQTFYLCKNLLCVTCDKKNIISGDLSNAFRRCTSLMSVSPNLISGSIGAVPANYMFSGSSLKFVSAFSFACSDMASMFYESNVQDVDFAKMDTSACTATGTMFYNCYAIRSIKNLDISNLTTIPSNWAINSDDLETLTFAGETALGGITIVLTSASLGHSALVEMIASLPVATAAATITITGNPGASELTDAEIAVATAKNWTITI